MDVKKLPFSTHLQKLKKLLILSSIAIGVSFLICYPFSDKLFNVLTAPVIEAMPPGSTLIFRSVAEAFFTYMKVGFVASLMLSSPFILYLIWRFVSYRLDQDKRKYAILFVLGGSFFFILGILFGYFVALPLGFRFLLRYTTQFIRPMPDMNAYLSFSVRFLLAFGLVFELPMASLVLTRAGIIDAKVLSSQRRYAILLIFILGVIIAPPDILSQVLLAIPLIGLYEVSILLAKIFGIKPDRILTEGTH